jgi:IS5 family transposase
MKAHIGVDHDFGLVQTLLGTVANVDDVTAGNCLLNWKRTEVFADAGYQALERRDDTTGVIWHVAMRPSLRRQWKKHPRVGKWTDHVERLKASVRAKAERPFAIIKNRFGLKKVRSRELANNAAQLFTLVGLANLLTAKRRWFALPSQSAL